MTKKDTNKYRNKETGEIVKAMRYNDGEKVDYIIAHKDKDHTVLSEKKFNEQYEPIEESND